ncbi:MAG TPA: hypothetical protein VGJ05_06350 [Fimbriiglobus sp.]|jgi:hypothetical protein
MVATTPRNDDEIERLGEEMIEGRIKPHLVPADESKFIAVDVDSGDFELDKDDYSAVTRLRTRRPDAEFWLGRAGYPTAYQFRTVR